jgi:cell division protein FtsI/penicillin-binding protein 2
MAPEAVAAAREGMRRVVASRAGSAEKLRIPMLTVAAKTGTAQAAQFKEPVRDASGSYVRDQRGLIVREAIPPSTPARENPELPWYISFNEEGTDFKHSWIIGYAPVDDPQIAFAVMVEYGGSGGATAGAIARQLLDACIQHGYLLPDKSHQTTRTDQR